MLVLEKFQKNITIFNLTNSFCIVTALFIAYLGKMVKRKKKIKCFSQIYLQLIYVIQDKQKPTQNHCIEFTGITKEQAEQAVKMMPKDPKVLAGMVTDKLAGGKTALQEMGLPGKRERKTRP